MHLNHHELAHSSKEGHNQIMLDPHFTVRPNPDVGFQLVRETKHFLIINKPAGLVTQPGRKHQWDSLLNGLFAHYGKALQNLGKKRDFGLLHRLDRPTSGLILVGLTIPGYDGLRQQFVDRLIGKTYLTLVHNTPQPPGGTEETPIREMRKGGRKRAILGYGRGAKEAVTKYGVIVHSGKFSLIKCQPKTGRLHQIRVHMAHRGCPVVGDTEYGKRTPIDRRMGEDALCLHAAQLDFRHPVSGKHVSANAPIPAAMLSAIGQVGITCPQKWC